MKNEIFTNLFLIFIFFLLSIIHFLFNLNSYDILIILYRLNIYIQELLIASILSFSGFILQLLLFNPIVEPYILGISSSASFGAVIAIFFGFTPLIIFRTFFSILFSFLITLIILFLSKKKYFFSSNMALLTGVGLNSLFSSLIIFLQSMLFPNDLQSSIFFIMGNIDYISYYEILILCFGFILLNIYIINFNKELEIYQTGEEMALAVGVDANKLKLFGFLSVCISVGICVSLCGVIGFIGLIIPHIYKFLFKSQKIKLLQLFLLSSILIIISGIISRNLFKGTILPLGVVTSLIGSPIFIYILYKNIKH